MPADKYPIPDHAAYIWTNGSKIMLTFPGYKGNEDRNFNTVTLDPKDPSSLFVMWNILQARANAKYAEDRKIASKATPVQYDLEQIKKYMSGKGPPKRDISNLSVADMMKELGL